MVNRPYEISLWTLQDGFISILGSNELEHYRGRMSNGEIVLKTDGTESFSAKVPMHIFNGKKLVDNPLWYDYKRGLLLANLRKIKVIFNKHNKENEKVYEFVIMKTEDTHGKGRESFCSVECEGLAFQELGKIGYKISLSQEDFEREYTEWFESTDPEKGEAPVATLKYWAEKIFKNTNWKVEYKMDWSYYSDKWDSDKVYEDEYVSSWTVDENGKISPNSIEMSKEKARMFSGEKSNIYNLSQSLAETFGVYCRYEYEYDTNYRIVGRKCIFYNSFYLENEKELNITYPYDTEILTRTSESKDLVTKLYVLPIEDSNYEGGLVSIMGSDANKSKEDYILNFDYLYEVEGINEEQYNEIEPYLERMRDHNNKLDSISKSLSEIEKQLVDLRARETILNNSLSECDERCNEAVNRINSYLGNEKGVLIKDANSPDFEYLVLDNNDTYKINLTQEGISQETVKLYLKYNALNSELDREIEDLQEKASFNVDGYGNLTSISNIEITPEEGEQIGLCYLTYEYTPILPYQNIYKIYSELRANNEAELEKIREEIETEETNQANYLAEYNLLLENKSKDVAAFEKMMGTSLKEGYWQPENYQDYGEKRSVNVSNSSNSEVSFFYDDVAFEGEFESGYEEGAEQEYKNYPYIVLNIPSDKNIKSIYNRISLFTSNEEIFPFINTNIYTVGSQLKYGFVGDENKLVLFIVDKSFEIKNHMILGINTSGINDKGQLEFSYDTIQTLSSSSIIFPVEKNNINKYPRIKIANPLVKTNYEDLLLKSGNKVLEKYYDYTILYEKSYPYIILKPETIIQYGNEYILDYFVSNAATGIYLDALQVSKSNAFPQVSYEVSLTDREKKFNTFLWLGRLALINDYDLKLFAVQGYVSEVSLVLDKPQSDKVSIQNYKTDFEDLFSKIVASSESMKMKQAAYDRVSSAFLGGTVKLTEESLSSTFDSSNLSMAFEKGSLKIDEANGIWGISDDGVVAYRGGGIFCATEMKDGNYIWNTGITPKGINASLITTGQLDTNLIRIFSGNNIRLQMNANGLIAYKLNEEGNPDPNNYVIHEGEGLFFRSRPNEESDFIDRVAISWDGLTLRNVKNEKVFYANADTGDLTITGTINATGGNIGELVVEKLIEVDYPQIEIKANDGYFFKNDEIEELNFTISGLLLDITENTDFLFYDANDSLKNSLEGENLDFDGTDLKIRKEILGTSTKKSIVVECHKTEIVDGEEKETVYTSQIDLYLIQDGQNGSPGEPGRGIVSSVVSYARTAENVTDPSSITNWDSSIPTEGGRKLWTRTELNYTDGQKEVFYTNSVDGEKGETGNGIKNITIQYTKGSPSSNPEELTGWQNSPNGISLGSNEVLWTKTTIEYTNNSTPTVSYTKSGEKGASGENGTSAYSAVVSSSGGDSFKTTTDWSVLYCNVYKGGDWLEGPGANLFYLNEETIPTGIAYADMYFYIIDTNNENSFSYYKYTEDGKNYIAQSAPTLKYDYTWTRFDENGVKTAGFNKSGPMIYISRDDINIKATYFCEVSGE